MSERPLEYELLRHLAEHQSISFENSVTMGMVKGISVVDKFGINPLITTGTDPEDIWEGGGKYNYDAVGTAPIAYMSCANALDTGQTIEISGLDVGGNEVVQTAETTGNANVTLDTPLWRVYRAQNISDDGLGLAGLLYVHTDPVPSAGVPLTATIRAIINDGNNQTLMALYTIPKGKVGFLYRGEFGLELSGGAGALAEYCKLQYRSRRFGKLFTVKKEVTAVVGGSAAYMDKRSFPDVIPALTDIQLVSQEVSTTMGVWGAFDIMLVDEDMFSELYLQAIGQPT
jgi:hypothetical protein